MYKLISEKYLADRHEMVISLLEGVDKVCRGRKIALLSYNNEALMETFRNKCKLLKISKPAFSVTTAMPTNRLGGYEEIFNHM